MVSLCKQNLIFVSFCLLQPHEKTWHFTENCNQTNYVMENLKTFKLGMTKLEKTKKNVVRVAVHKCDEKLGVNFAFRGCWVRISAVTILLVSSLASWQELWLELFADDITDLVCMKLPPRSPAVYRGRAIAFLVKVLMLMLIENFSVQNWHIGKLLYKFNKTRHGVPKIFCFFVISHGT